MADKIHPRWEEAYMTLTDIQKLCPFAHEHSRGPGELHACTERYVKTCGCQKVEGVPPEFAGIPRARNRWKRHQ